MLSRRWKRFLSASLCATLSLGLGASTILRAQESADKAAKKAEAKAATGAPNVLPEVKVQGTPPTETTPVPPPTPSDAPPTDIPPQNTPAPNTDAGPTAGFYNSPFSSPPSQGYSASDITTGTLVNSPILTTPQSISVVTQDVIRDQQAIRLGDVLRNVGSAQIDRQPRGNDALFLRGFQVLQRDFRKNGLIDPSFAPRDLANVERIEVLKGPASVLYGAGQPAGVVNYITKKPLDTLQHEANLMVGSHGLARMTADSTGPLRDNGNVLYRLNVAYEDNDGFRDFGLNRRFFIAPVATWVIDEDTSITFEGEYLNDQRRFDSGVIPIGGAVGVLPITRYLGEPSDYSRFEDRKVSMFLNHKFNEDWALRVGAAAFWYDAPSRSTVPTQAFFPLPPPLIQRIENDITQFEEVYSTVVGNVTGQFDTGALHHQAVFGTEMGWFNSRNFSAVTSISLNPFVPVAPTYGAAQPLIPIGSFDADFKEFRYGFYASDMIDLTSRLKFLVGARYDISDTSFSRQAPGLLPVPDRITSDQTFYRWTPRVGLVYELIEDALAPYVMYSQSFAVPPGGLRASTARLAPENGETVEAGIKADMLGQMLQVQLAGFHTVKSNVIVDNSTILTTQVGQQTNQGFEASATGKLTDRLAIIGNYSYIDARITSDLDPTLVGNRFRNIPYNNMNLWVRYNVIDDCKQTLGLALGPAFVDDRFGDLGNTFRLPEYTRWDSGLYYTRGNINASLYLENMFDRQYYASSLDQFSVYPGAPVTARAQFGLRF